MHDIGLTNYTKSWNAIISILSSIFPCGKASNALNSNGKKIETPSIALSFYKHFIHNLSVKVKYKNTTSVFSYRAHLSWQEIRVLEISLAIFLITFSILRFFFRYWYCPLCQHKYFVFKIELRQSDIYFYLKLEIKCH